MVIPTPSFMMLSSSIAVKTFSTLSLTTSSSIIIVLRFKPRSSAILREDLMSGESSTPTEYKLRLRGLTSPSKKPQFSLSISIFSLLSSAISFNISARMVLSTPPEKIKPTSVTFSTLLKTADFKSSPSNSL